MIFFCLVSLTLFSFPESRNLEKLLFHPSDFNIFISIFYSQSVKFKGFYKMLQPQQPQTQPQPLASASALSQSTQAPQEQGKSSTPVRKTGLRSLESTPSSSSGSLNSLNRPPALATASAGATSIDLSSPIYQCASLHESRAKNLCRKQPLRMLEHTQSEYCCWKKNSKGFFLGLYRG